MTRVIALHGYAGVGKDTLAKMLNLNYGYARYAFADRLKGILRATNPIVHVNETTGEIFRLDYLVFKLGWDDTKRMFPEVRTLLQHLGSAARDFISQDVWIRPLLHTIALHELVVITDLRMPNELAELKSAGFGEVTTVHVKRNGVGPINDHPSEIPLPCDISFDLSDYPIEQMDRAADDLISAAESFQRKNQIRSMTLEDYYKKRAEKAAS